MNVEMEIRARVYGKIQNIKVKVTDDFVYVLDTREGGSGQYTLAHSLSKSAEQRIRRIAKAKQRKLKTQ